MNLKKNFKEINHDKLKTAPKRRTSLGIKNVSVRIINKIKPK